jgi:hypothetical protein
LTLDIPIPPPPEDLDALRGKGPHLQEVKPLDTNYPGHHHQRWYFFWPQQKPLPPIKPLPPPPVNSLPSPIQQPQDKSQEHELQKQDEFQKQIDKTILQTPPQQMPSDGKEDGRNMISSLQSLETKEAAGNDPVVLEHEPPPSKHNDTVHRDRATRESSKKQSTTSNSPTDLCQRCGVGRYKKKTTPAGYATMVIFFPVGIYAYLTKKCFTVESCTYCDHLKPEHTTRDKTQKSDYRILT